ncbi:MAG: response regulator [Chloroflexi bacterium]|nr:response regulator [Chloroflexota bacterium]
MPNVMDRNKIVVVLEDDHQVRGLLAGILQDLGYYVVPVERGERALAVLQQVRATLLIMDLLLPGMDGREVLRQLRSDERTRDVPVMVLSDHIHMVDNNSKGKRNAILKKPLRIDDVVAEVERIVGKVRSGSLVGADFWAPAS